MKKKILSVFSDKGILADSDAVDTLARAPDAMKCVEAIINDANRPLVLTKGDVAEYIAACHPHDVLKNQPPTEEVSKPLSLDGPPSETVKVLKDITGNSTCVGDIIDFAKLFNDRYSALKKILARRRELSGLLPIQKAKKAQKDIRFVAIVNDIHTTKNGHTMLDVEDDEARAQVLIMKGSKLIGTFVKDEVIGIVGSMSRDGEIFVAKEVIRPEVPVSNPLAPSRTESVIAFVSDLHVGSSEFLKDEWKRFVRWLGKDAVAKDIRYILMPGDLVDGIGIYPGQEDELAIEDVYEQYGEVAKLLSEIPERIRIILMPGNHDAVRLAEPQPALPDQIKEMFDQSRIQFVGNPCYLEIEGRTILAYHGRSMDDFVGNVRELSYKDPADIMKEMLRRRHMAPTYGQRTALAPEQRDYLVIDTVPDIFVTGHVHACAVSEYRGIRLINASAWQSQTAFQRMHNQEPDPAKVPMVHLGTGETWVEDFAAKNS